MEKERLTLDGKGERNVGIFLDVHPLGDLGVDGVGCLGVLRMSSVQ